MLLLGLLLLPAIALSELAFVAVIWRHGDRAPGSLPYPLDAHNESAWPRGWNQLTNEGIKETNDLGAWLRERYVTENEHIKGVFDRKEVLVRSTDSERALASAQSVAAGLFPPEAEFVWKRGLAWQPTPIHSNGEHTDDPLLKPTSVACAAYDKLREAEMQPLIKSLNETNDDVFRMLSRNTGMEISALNVEDLYDVTREIAHGLKQPEWLTDEVLARIKDIKRRIRLNEFDTPAKARLRGGFLLGDWHARINAAAAGEKGALKTVLYSAHDGTLLSLLSVMGVGDGELVPYAAAIVAELHRTNGREFVQLWYRNDSSAAVTAAPLQLTLPGCEPSCPLATFNRIVAPLTINTTQQLTQMCNLSSGLAPSLLLLFLYALLSR